MLGGMEILCICALIGAIFGYFFRDKAKENSTLIGIVLGLIGSVLMNLLLLNILFQSYIAMPIYAIFGVWLFNFIFLKIQKRNNSNNTEL